MLRSMDASALHPAARNWSVFVGDVIVEDSVVREMPTTNTL
jgi:hypothetical protein